MDIVPVISGNEYFSWTDRAIVSRVLGVLTMAFAYILDIKSKKDYSFWLYLFGLLIFTSGFSVFYNRETFLLIVFGAVHIVFVIVSVILNRTVFLVFGTIGIVEFLSRLSYLYFEGSPMFPFSLTVIGVMLIIAGIYYQKNKQTIENSIKAFIPEVILKLKPNRLEG